MRVESPSSTEVRSAIFPEARSCRRSAADLCVWDYRRMVCCSRAGESPQYRSVDEASLPVLGEPKTLILIRHGQGKHNPPGGLALRFLAHLLLRSDARLTRKGRAQARAVRPVLAQVPPFDLVVTSPLSRAIETATEIFPGEEPPKLLHHLLCERCQMPADEGSPRSQLLALHPQLRAWRGLDDLPEHYWPRRSLRNCDKEVRERVAAFRAWLLARPEQRIAIVGHSAWFKCFTGRESKLGHCEPYLCKWNGSGEAGDLVAVREWLLEATAGAGVSV